MIPNYYTVARSDNLFCKMNAGRLETDRIARKSCIRPDFESAEDLLKKILKMHDEDIKRQQDRIADTMRQGNNDPEWIQRLEGWLAEDIDVTYSIIYVSFTEATGNE